MSYSTKYQLSRAVVALTVPIICYAFAQMIPAGLNGDTDRVWPWFTVAMVTTVLGCVSVILMQSNKAKSSQEHMSETEVLSAAAAQLAREKQADQRMQGRIPPEQKV